MAVPAQYELANLLAVLSVGRKPQWTEQLDNTGAVPEYDGPPDRNAAGVDLDNAARSLVCVRLRREVHRRTAIVTPGTFDAATTYTTTVSGTAIASTGATLALLLTDIAADININGTTSLIVSATVVDEDGDGVNDSVKIVGLAEADFYIAVSVAAGTGTIAVSADPASCTARVYCSGRAPNAPGRLGAAPAEGDSGAWVYMNGQFYTLTYRGFMEEFTTAGIGSLYIELAAVTGHASDVGVTYTPRVWIGPCVQETDT